MSLIVLGFISIQAQSNGGDYVPKAGGIALGASINVEDVFYKTSVGDKVPALCAKYYLSDNTAIRATFRINSTNNTNKYYVQDDAAFLVDPLSKKELVDLQNSISSGYYSSLAVQQFLGGTRLRGFIGIQALYGNSNSKTINTYTNTMNALNPTPTSSTLYTGTAFNERVLEVKNENGYNIGAGIIAGFEYYVIPHLSIGGEISLNAIYSHSGQEYTKSESVVNGEVVTVNKTVSPGGSGFEIRSLGFASNANTDQLGFYIMVHF